MNRILVIILGLFLCSVGASTQSEFVPPPIPSDRAQAANDAQNDTQLRRQQLGFGTPAEPVPLSPPATAQVAPPVVHYTQAPAPAPTYSQLNQVQQGMRELTYEGQPLVLRTAPNVSTLVYFPHGQEIQLANSGDVAAFDVQKHAHNILTIQPLRGSVEAIINVVMTDQTIYTLWVQAPPGLAHPDIQVRIVQPPPPAESNAEIGLSTGFDMIPDLLQRRGRPIAFEDRYHRLPNGALVMDIKTEAGRSVRMNPLSKNEFLRPLILEKSTARSASLALSQFAAHLAARTPNINPSDASHFKRIADGDVLLDVGYTMFAPRGYAPLPAAAPLTVSTDGAWTYINFGANFSSIDMPIVMEQRGNVEVPTNTRTIGSMIVVQNAASALVLRWGDSALCVRRTPAGGWQ